MKRSSKYCLIIQASRTKNCSVGWHGCRSFPIAIFASIQVLQASHANHERAAGPTEPGSKLAMLFMKCLFLDDLFGFLSLRRGWQIRVDLALERNNVLF